MTIDQQTGPMASDRAPYRAGKYCTKWVVVCPSCGRDRVVVGWGRWTSGNGVEGTLSGPRYRFDGPGRPRIGQVLRREELCPACILGQVGELLEAMRGRFTVEWLDEREERVRGFPLEGRPCAMCLGAFDAERRDRVFCSGACKQRFYRCRRNLADGKGLGPRQMAIFEGQPARWWPRQSLRNAFKLRGE